MRYQDRRHAGRLLAEALRRYAGQPCNVFALPRGGVPVAFEIAQALRASLDLILVRKIGVPYQPELALAAVADAPTPEIVVNERVAGLVQLDDDAFADAVARAAQEIERRRERYLSGRKPASPAGRITIVVDDGLATGATARAALRALRRQDPKRLVLAIPVAPAQTVAELKSEADEVVCLQAIEDFGAVGSYYRDFTQIEDQEVVDLLAAARTWMPSAAGDGRPG